MIHLSVQISYQGGSFTNVIDDIITGRSADAYQKEYLVSFDRTKIDRKAS